jgi:hypothetical protein
MTQTANQNEGELNEVELANVTGGTLADVGKEIVAVIKYQLGIPITTHATDLN